MSSHVGLDWPRLVQEATNISVKLSIECKELICGDLMTAEECESPPSVPDLTK